MAATIIQANQLRKEWEGNFLFEGVHLAVTDGERVAVFGRNGCGKTTLLRIVLGDILADGGTVAVTVPPERRGWVEQQLPEEDRTLGLLELVLKKDPQRYSAKRQLETLQTRLGEQVDSSIYEAYEQTLSYMEADGYAWEQEAEQMLLRLKLGKELWKLSL